MASIQKKQLPVVRKMYEVRKMSMQDIADELGVTIDAVTYFMRKHKIKRRSSSETNRHKFNRKPATFSIRNGLEKDLEKHRIIVAMLYWAEGYKTEKSGGIDFANSDVDMIKIFISSLRHVFCLDENRFRILLYCYSNQDVQKLISFWSDVVGVSKEQFTKPYIRNDYRRGGRKMKYGLIHIRYHDKKLLLEVKKLIESYKQEICVGTEVVKQVWL